MSCIEFGAEIVFCGKGALECTGVLPFTPEGTVPDLSTRVLEKELGEAVNDGAPHLELIRK